MSSITAERWMSMCRPILDARVNIDGSMDIRGQTDEEIFAAGQCKGALDAISILVALVDNGKPTLRVCQPPAHSTAQWAAIFTNYTKRHPKRYSEPFAFVMLAALQEAYPCGGK